MGWLLAVLGLVALVQGVGWTASGSGDAKRRARSMAGVFLSPMGLLALGLGLLWVLVPEFWGG